MRRALALLATAAVGVTGGLGLGAAVDRASTARAAGAGAAAQVLPTGAGAPAGAPATPALPPATREAGLDRARLGAALRRGAARAEGLGGEVQAALWAPEWRAPATAGDASRRMRMWSMSKPVTALALHLLGRPDAATRGNIARAIRRSENCPQREVVLALQEAAGGASAAARHLDGLLAEAGARADLPAEPLPGACPGGERPALQLGTSTWSVRDAVALARALGAGRFGAPGRTVLELMRRPKLMSEEAGAGTHTMDPAFGAGTALADFAPAYKSGWGGSADGTFLVGQFGVAEVDGRPLAFAVMFHPARSPERDDPGIDPNDDALEAVLRPVAQELHRAR